MNSLQLAITLAATYLVAFAEARFPFLRNTLGTQIDLLPALVVCIGLTTSLTTTTLAGTTAALWLDALSANPFGISLLPLALTGLAAHALRDLLVRNDAYTQYLLGLAASALIPILTLGLLILFGANPLVGPWFIWRWIAGAALGAAFTPLFVILIRRLQQALSYQPEPSVSFRPDREIDRGRDPHAHH